jgi:hypothetical protein
MKNEWTPKGAFRWLMNHHLIPMKTAHRTKNYIRFRIQDPRNFQRFFTKSLEKGIKLIIGYKV